MITYSLTARIEKENLSHTINVNNVTASMTKVGLMSTTLPLSGTASQIDTSNLTTPGMCFIRNLNTSTLSTAQVGVVDNSNQYLPIIDLRPGEQSAFRIVPATTYYVIGRTGTTVRVDVTEA